MNDALLLKLEAYLEQELTEDRHASHLYLITGSMDEPAFGPLAELDGVHPCDVLHQLWEAGVRAPDDAFALALVAEGTRHLKFEELSDDLRAKFTEIADENQADMQTAWAEFVVSTPVLAMPETMRIETRNSVAVLDTGWTIMVIRDHNAEPEVLPPVPPARLERSRVPHFMWLFLMGQEPTD